MKIYCRCLRPDIEYKTLVINYQTSCKELIMMLLNKAKMKHRDPKLFYLTMEVGVRKSGTGICFIKFEMAVVLPPKRPGRFDSIVILKMRFLPFAAGSIACAPSNDKSRAGY